MYLILVNGGGSSPFDKIALKHDRKLGINSLKKTSGKDFIYRCYDFSLANFQIRDLISHQLNLIFN